MSILFSMYTKSFPQNLLKFIKEIVQNGIFLTSVFYTLKSSGLNSSFLPAATASLTFNTVTAVS